MKSYAEFLSGLSGSVKERTKKEFEKFCGDKDLSELVDLYEIERQL